MDRTAQLVARHEGLRLQPYRCPAGYLTIGYGRNLDHVGITEAEAEELLENDLRRVAAGLCRALPWFVRLDGARQAALMDMGFNLGVRGLVGFRRMLAALEAGDWTRAEAEALDSRWAGQVGPRARRVARMLATGEWPPDVGGAA